MASKVLEQYRAKNPGEAGKGDIELASELYVRNYSDLGLSDFANRVGVSDVDLAGKFYQDSYSDLEFRDFASRVGLELPEDNSGARPSSVGPGPARDGDPGVQEGFGDAIPNLGEGIMSAGRAAADFLAENTGEVQAGTRRGTRPDTPEAEPSASRETRLSRRRAPQGGETLNDAIPTGTTPVRSRSDLTKPVEEEAFSVTPPPPEMMAREQAAKEAAEEREAYRENGWLSNAGSSIKRGASRAIETVEVLSLLDSLSKLSAAQDRLSEQENIDPASLADPVNPAYSEEAIRRRMDSASERDRAAVERYQSDVMEAASSIAETQRERGELGEDPILRDALKSGDSGEFLAAFWEDPISIITGLVGESLVSMAPALAAGGAGGLVAGPAGFAAGTGSVSAATEAAFTVVEKLREFGADLNDPESVQKVWSESRDKIMSDAATRGLVIGAFDAVSGGIAGARVIAPAARGADTASRVTRNTADFSAKLAAQGGLGAGGELYAQIGTDGRVTNGAEVWAEGLAEFGFAPLEITTAGYANARRKLSGKKTADELERSLKKEGYTKQDDGSFQRGDLNIKVSDTEAVATLKPRSEPVATVDQQFRAIDERINQLQQDVIAPSRDPNGPSITDAEVTVAQEEIDSLLAQRDVLTQRLASVESASNGESAGTLESDVTESPADRLDSILSDFNQPNAQPAPVEAEDELSAQIEALQSQVSARRDQLRQEGLDNSQINADPEVANASFQIESLSRIRRDNQSRRSEATAARIADTGREQTNDPLGQEIISIRQEAQSKPSPIAAEAQRLRQKRESQPIKTPEAKADNSAQPTLRSNGKPFSSEKTAKASKAYKSLDGAEVVPVDGGFGVISRPANTAQPEENPENMGTDVLRRQVADFDRAIEAAPSAAVRNDLTQSRNRVQDIIDGRKPKLSPAERARRQLVVDPGKDDLVTAIQKFGGIDTDLESDFAGRLKPFQNRRVGLPGIEQPAGKGRSLDDLAEVLSEYGYLEKRDVPELYEKLDQIEQGVTLYSREVESQIIEDSMRPEEPRGEDRASIDARRQEEMQADIEESIALAAEYEQSLSEDGARLAEEDYLPSSSLSDKRLIEAMRYAGEINPDLTERIAIQSVEEGLTKDQVTERVNREIIQRVQREGNTGVRPQDEGRPAQTPQEEVGSGRQEEVGGAQADPIPSLTNASDNLDVQSADAPEPVEAAPVDTPAVEPTRSRAVSGFEDDPVATTFDEARTGVPLRTKGYRVDNINPDDFGADARPPILGRGQYTTPTPEEAARFSPDPATAQVAEQDVDIERPLVIENDAQWSQVTRSAGWDFVVPIGQTDAEAQPQVDAMQSYLRDEGYDGIVIKFDPNELTDTNANGDSIKRIRDVFQEPQAVRFDSPEADTDTEAPRFSIADDQSVEAVGVDGTPRPETTGLDLNTARQSASRLMSNWKIAPRVNVVETELELPQSIQNQIAKKNAQGKAEGVFYDGEIYLVASNLFSIDRMEAVVLHEVIGHFGLRNLLGDQMNSVLDGVYMSVGRSALSPIADKYGYNLDKPEDRRSAAEEYLSVLAESDPGSKIIERLVSMIADWIRAMGFKVEMSSGEIRDMLVRSKRLVQEGEIVTGVTIDQPIGGGVGVSGSLSPEAEEEKIADTARFALAKERGLPIIPSDSDIVSPRLPTAKTEANRSFDANRSYGRLTVNTLELSGLDARQAAIIEEEYANYRPTSSATESMQVINRFKNHIENNLLWLYDGIPENIREDTKQWYVGANRVTKAWANRYGLQERQVAAVIAALSPQKDWFQNASLAERLLDVMAEHQSTPWSSAMTKTMGRIYAKPEYKALREEIKGKALGDLDSKDQIAAWIRVFDEANNDRAFREINPDGSFGDYVQTGDQANRKAAWGSNSEIAKAVGVVLDGSPEQINQTLGSQHKVRNFYNNIVAPQDQFGSVTIDTHAVAAGLLQPLSGNSMEVLHNFGGNVKGQPGPGSSAKYGISGMYPIYAEAYRSAAKKRGILPREMQSITWEAVRALFTPAFKQQQANVDKVHAEWMKYKKGGQSLEKTRARVWEIAGGIDNSRWLRSNPRRDDPSRRATYERAVSSTRISRSGLREGAASGRGNGDDPGAIPRVEETARFSLANVYPIEHRPLSAERGASTLDDLTTSFPDDIYTEGAARVYGSGDLREIDVMRTIRRVRGKPGAMVTVHRGVPKGVSDINAGDWVTLSRPYAQDVADEIDGSVISKRVPAESVTAWADSLLENGYYPRGEAISEEEAKFSFAGAKSKYSEQNSLRVAEKMRARNTPNHVVFRDTGWFQGADGMMRYEISDDDAKLMVDSTDKRFYRLHEVLSHPRLYAAYPELRNAIVHVRGMNGANGRYRRGSRIIELAPREQPADMLSTLLHEVQHAIQAIEGFAVGGNSSESVWSSIKNAMESLSTKASMAVLEWDYKNPDINAEIDEAAFNATMGLRFQSADRLRSYGSKERPSGVLRLIRRELQWIHDPDLRDTESSQQIQADFYSIPPSGQKRNDALRDIAFRAAELIEGSIPSALRSEFKLDSRKIESMVKSLSREATRQRARLGERSALQEEAERARSLKASEALESPYYTYLALAGEVEARNVQRRMNMSEDARRDIPPMETMDVADDKVIVVMGSQEMIVPKSMADDTRTAEAMFSFRTVRDTTSSKESNSEANRIGLPVKSRNDAMFERTAYVGRDRNGEWVPVSTSSEMLRDQAAVKKWWKWAFTKEGQLGEAAYMRHTQMIGMRNADEINISGFTADFINVAEKAYGKPYRRITDNQKKEMNNFLTGNNSANVPSDVKEQLRVLRGMLDRGSSQLQMMLLDEVKYALQDAPPEQSAELAELIRAAKSGDRSAIGQMSKVTPNGSFVARKMATFFAIESNKGEYLHRSYRLFDEPGWKKKIPADVMKEARDFIRAEIYADGGFSNATQAQIEERVDGTINTILNSNAEGIVQFMSEQIIGEKDLTIFKERQNVPEPIRKLMGEHTDPRVNFARTMTHMSKLLSSHHFLRSLREDGLGVFLSSTWTSTMSKKIATFNDDRLVPLAGLWATEDFADALVNKVETGQIGMGVDQLIKLNSAIKYGKTVLAPTTMARNFWSASLFTVMNGHFNWKYGADAFGVVRADVAGNYNGNVREYMQNLARLGVIHDTARGGELRAAIEDVITLQDNGGGFAKRGLKKVLDTSANLYQAGDDFWKVVGFENEKQSLMRYGMPEKEAEAEAASRIRNGYPTYSMVPEGIQLLRRFPLIGTFVSFPWESVRTSINQVGMVVDDFKAGRTRLATQRLIGMSIASSAAWGLSVGTMALLGIDKEDDEANRKMAAPWQMNSQFLYFTPKDYLDLSHLDPYNFWKRVLTVLNNGNYDSIDEKIIASFSEVLSPFLGADIGAQAIVDVWSNRKAGTEQTIADPTANWFSFNAQKAAYFIDQIKPGVFGNVERILKAANSRMTSYGKEYTLGSEALGLIGFRITNADPKVSLQFKSYDMSQAIREASGPTMRVMRNPNDIKPSQVVDGVERSYRRWEKAFDDMHSLIRAARVTGMTDQEIAISLERGNIAKKYIGPLLNDITPPWAPSEISLRNAVNGVLQFNDTEEGRRSIQKRMAVLRQAIQAESARLSRQNAGD
ncbi:DUF7178 family protein [Spiribacter onubensis]|uniref:LPD23 domain-containing protein n=1 Tax=Spiribacter onubensis TaxID=3122420 RepID=A0ABV3S822_9GAMM